METTLKTRAKMAIVLTPGDVDSDYELCLVKDLRTFHENRRIQATSSVKKPRALTKAKLIEALREDDESYCFNFLSLPPELRSMVYEFVMLNSADDVIDNTSRSLGFDYPIEVPAICQVARQLRQESLLSHFRANGFTLHLETVTGGKNFSDDASCEISRDTLAKLRYITNPGLARITTLQIAIGPGIFPDGEQFINIAFTSQGDAPVTPKLQVRLVNASRQSTSAELDDFVEHNVLPELRRKVQRTGAPCFDRRDLEVILRIFIMEFGADDEIQQ